MRFFIFTVVLCTSIGCAGARLEKLAQNSAHYDESKATSGIPVPQPVSDEHEVTHRVQLKTNYGTIVVGLYGKDAPHTVENFLYYLKQDFYSGTIFHRIIPGFMIQGGGYTAELEKKNTDAPIALELIPGLHHKLGTVSMARTAEAHSATSQFFICVADTVQLNGEYAAFGTVEEGIGVVQKISQVKTESKETDIAVIDDVPVSPVIIESIAVIQ